jgi:hypothetical protein
MKYTDEYLKSVKYHHLTFLRRLPSEKCIENGKRQGLWKCDCGKEFPYKIYDVVRGNKQSCGCVNFRGNQSVLWKGHGEIAGIFWRNICRGAKNRNHKIKITIEDAWNQFLKQNRKCALTGEELSFDYTKSIKNCTASLDRIDSTKDYTLDNIQWVHKIINIMKHCYNQDNFISWCNKVTEHNKSNA